jgi:hypothetical protein
MQLRSIGPMRHMGGRMRLAAKLAIGIWAGIALALGAVSGISPAHAAVTATAPKLIQICHGYGCAFRSRLMLTASDGARFLSIMSAGSGSPNAERAALKKAVSYFDGRANQATGYRDRPKTEFGKPERGQMDCVDESTNTRALLVYLSERGLLKFHKVQRNTSRGFFLDGRYPHWTAVISDPQGTKWVVDPWYASVSGAPDIFPLDQWKVRGQFESGELD